MENKTSMLWQKSGSKIIAKINSKELMHYQDALKDFIISML